jgi:hypothetical protein
MIAGGSTPDSRFSAPGGMRLFMSAIARTFRAYSQTRLQHWLLLGSVVLLPACSDQVAIGDTLPARANEPIQTDTTIYTARLIQGVPTNGRFAFPVVTRFANPAPDTIFLARCLPDFAYPLYSVVALEQTSPAAAYSQAWACGSHDQPVIVAPGQIRIDTLYLNGPNAWNDGIPVGLLDGIFRLSFSRQGCRSDIGCGTPLELIDSNAFRVILR